MVKTDKIERIRSLLKRLEEFRKDGTNKESIDNWKEEAFDVLEENQLMRFRRLKLYENIPEYSDDDLPF